MALQTVGIEVFFPFAFPESGDTPAKTPARSLSKRKLHKAKTPYIMVQKDETALKMLSEKV